MGSPALGPSSGDLAGRRVARPMCHARRSALTATLELLRRTAQEREVPVTKRLAASVLAPDSGPVLASFTVPVAIGVVVKELAWAEAEVEACAEAGAEIEACAVAEAGAEAKSVVTAIAAVKLVRGLAKATGTTELAEGPEPISTAVVVVAEATGAVAAITTEAVRPTTESVAAAATATPSEAEEQVT